MGAFLLRFVLGSCRHLHESRPFTLNGQTYKVCLCCAKTIPYSLERMAPLTSRECRDLRRFQDKAKTK
jgi:hypothetical protein